MPIRPLPATLALFALLTPHAVAQPIAEHPRVREAAAALDKWLDGQRAFKQIPGITAGVVVDQQLIWEGAYGFADLGRKTPVTVDHLYSICSISKLFTSLALLQLRDQGRLRLDDPITKHLPWFIPPAGAPNDGPITVEGLLTHTAGLQSEAADDYWLEPGMTFPTDAEVVKAVANRELQYRPGTYISYSNLGFTLAGAVVAAASGQPYQEYVRANLLGPLGLASTSPDMPADERGRRLVTGYSGIDRSNSRHPMPFYQTKAMASAAGYASNVRDLARFASWQFRLLAKGGTEVLRASTLREMQRVHFLDPDWKSSWGLGFQVWRRGDQTFVGHGGSCPGYRTQLLLKPEEKVAAIAMANTFDADATNLAQQAYSLFGPAIKEALADTAGKTPPPDPALDRYLGTYWSFGGEMEVIRWQGGLATMQIPSDDPVATIAKYRKVGEHTFRRVRADGELGERMVFDLGPDGRPIRARTNYLMARLR